MSAKFFEENMFENVCEMLAILSQPQCVNICSRMMLAWEPFQSSWDQLVKVESLYYMFCHVFVIYTCPLRRTDTSKWIMYMGGHQSTAIGNYIHRTAIHGIANKWKQRQGLNFLWVQATVERRGNFSDRWRAVRFSQPFVKVALVVTCSYRIWFNKRIPLCY